MPKHENGSNDVWECEGDYEESESPWILFEDERPGDQQRCLVWPGNNIVRYQAQSDSFLQNYESSDPRPVKYWMPLPEPPMTHEQYVEYETGTLMDVFTKATTPFIGDTVGNFRKHIMAALGVPEEMMQDFNVTKVEVNGDRIDYEVEVPYSLEQLNGDYAVEDDTDGNDS